MSCTDTNFNSPKWKNWKETESTMHMRWDMVDDLINNFDLIGKSKIEIKQLLGDTQEKSLSDDCTVYYYLGPCRNGINYGNLIINFKNGKVISIEKNCG